MVIILNKKGSNNKIIYLVLKVQLLLTIVIVILILIVIITLKIIIKYTNSNIGINDKY